MLIHTEYDKNERCLLANHVTYRTWADNAKTIRDLDPSRQLKKLLKNGREVWAGYPGEVESWLEVTRVFPEFGGLIKVYRPTFPRTPTDVSHG